ncbi:hypothetical protein MTR67_052817, partial [Solanum verrucosum]
NWKSFSKTTVPIALHRNGSYDNMIAIPFFGAEQEKYKIRMLLQITYHDKATQTETEEEDTIEKILKVITTLCTKVDSARYKS